MAVPQDNVVHKQVCIAGVSELQGRSGREGKLVESFSGLADSTDDFKPSQKRDFMNKCVERAYRLNNFES